MELLIQVLGILKLQIPPRWRVHYEDGSTYSDLDGPHYEAPTRAVVGVAFRRGKNGNERGLIHSVDYYWWLDNEWYGCMDKQGAGFFDYLFREGFEKYVLFGRTFNDEVWDTALKGLIADRLEA